MIRVLSGAGCSVAEVPEILRYSTTGSIRIEVNIVAGCLIREGRSTVSSLSLRIDGVALRSPAVIEGINGIKTSNIGAGAIVLMYRPASGSTGAISV